ncbi:MAG: hypothetical protein AB1345_00480 [Chloroflexota bacterium]
MVRTFNLLDLPLLYRYRTQGLCLDNTFLLTWGSTLFPIGAILGALLPSTGVFTYLAVNEDKADQPLLVQAAHSAGSALARLTFIAPHNVLNSSALSRLLEHIATQFGSRGAYNLIAEVEEKSSVFEALHQNHYSIYAWQRLWKLSDSYPTESCEPCWRPATDDHMTNIRQLIADLVPGMVKQIELQPESPSNGWVIRKDNELLAYVNLRYGPRGILAQPYIHPEADLECSHLSNLFSTIPNPLNRPVYISARSYQAWLDPMLEDINAEPGPLQAVIVKRLAATIPVRQPISLPSLEDGRPEISTPITHISNKNSPVSYDKTTYNR